MSKPSDRSVREPLTAKERSQAWYEHMREVLAQNPAYAGCTVLMRNHGRTYKFTIPIAPLPKVVANSTTPSQQSSRKGQQK